MLVVRFSRTKAKATSPVARRRGEDITVNEKLNRKALFKLRIWLAMLGCSMARSIESRPDADLQASFSQGLLALSM